MDNMQWSSIIIQSDFLTDLKVLHRAGWGTWLIITLSPVSSNANMETCFYLGQHLGGGCDGVGSAWPCLTQVASSQWPSSMRRENTTLESIILPRGALIIITLILHLCQRLWTQMFKGVTLMWLGLGAIDLAHPNLFSMHGAPPSHPPPVLEKSV